MIDLIVWRFNKRLQMYLDERAIQAVFDYNANDLDDELALQRELQSNDEERVAVIWLHGEQQPFYAFHDALQIAKAVNQAKCLSHSLNSGFDPIMVDE